MKPHLKLDKLLSVINEAKEIWNTIDQSIENNEDINFYRQAMPTMGHYSLGKGTQRWEYFRKNFYPLWEDPVLIEFYVGIPKTYKSSPHTDRGRSVAINIPVEVDLQNSNAFFGKYFGLKNYPSQNTNNYKFSLNSKETRYKKEINERYQGDYIAEYYDNVTLDCPVLFDPSVPHGGYNKADTQRVLMSLTFDSLDYKTAYDRCIELGWASEVSNT